MQRVYTIVGVMADILSSEGLGQGDCIEWRLVRVTVLEVDARKVGGGLGF